MATQLELRAHFLALGKAGAIYVWGANCQIITEDLMNRLCKAVDSEKYNKEYYDGKLEEGEGKPGADCSGAMKPVSGYDTTAQGYYNRCVEKGNIKDIPNKVCLVFRRKDSKKITHVGCYTGDGYVSEMASSKKNYQRKKLDKSEWDNWGMPDFIEDPDREFSGVWDCDTTSALQMALGTKVDGIVSNQKLVSKKYVPKASTKSWKFKLLGYKKGSSVIKALQRWLKGMGFYSGNIDGWCEKKTVDALQLFLREYDYYFGDLDSKMGPGTVRGLQMAIVDGVFTSIE
ncbi:MAG: peptidoglycan-binding protein [Agathobacter sp.]|nr:peptidoglycan-binding protein [Agathobacter sp.]